MLDFLKTRHKLSQGDTNIYLPYTLWFHMNYGAVVIEVQTSALLFWLVDYSMHRDYYGNTRMLQNHVNEHANYIVPIGLAGSPYFLVY